MTTPIKSMSPAIVRTPNMNARANPPNRPPTAPVIESVLKPPSKLLVPDGAVTVPLGGGVAVGPLKPDPCVPPGITIVGMAVGTTAKAAGASVSTGVGAGVGVTGLEF